MREIMLAKSVLMGDAERKRAYDEEGAVQEWEFVAWKQRRQKGASGSGSGSAGRTFVPG